MLDGTEKNPPNPTYMCVVKILSREQYITKKKALREGGSEGEPKTNILKRKPLKELNLFEEGRDRYIRANLST